MKRTILAVIFMSLPVIAAAGFPQNPLARDPGVVVVGDTVNRMLFNAVERTIALELRCATQCLPEPSTPGTD